MSLSERFRKDLATAWLAVAKNVEVEMSHIDTRSPQWQNALTRNTREVRKLIEHRALPPEKDRMYAIKTVCELYIKNWRTILDDGSTRPEIEVSKGEWLPFTQENAVKVFLEYPPFYTDVVDMGSDLLNYQVSDEARKN